MELLKFRLLQLLPVILLTCFLGTSEAIVNFRASAQSRLSFSAALETANSTSAASRSSEEFTLEEVKLSRHGNHPSAVSMKEQNQDPELLLEATQPPPAFSASIAHSPDIRAPDMEQEFGSLEGSGGDPQMDMIEFQKLVAKEQEDLEKIHQLPKGLELINLHYAVFKEDEIAEDQHSVGESRMKEVFEATSDTSEDALESDSDEETWKTGKFSLS